MKLAALLNLILLLIVPITSQTATVSPSNDDPAPYIYYYSEALNGIVIERADGTDSRIIGQGLVDEDVTFTYGPGWSADGTWFAWQNLTPLVSGFNEPGKGYITSTDGQTTLDFLNNFPCVNSMLWHPTENILLVYGSLNKDPFCPLDGYPIATYWLVDANSQRRLASFSINSLRKSGDSSAPTIYWLSDKHEIQFYELTSTNGIDNQYFLVTMSYDSTVTMTPITKDQYDAQPQSAVTSSNAFRNYMNTQFVRWQDITADRAISVPSNSSAAIDIPVGGQWDSSGKWLFVGYEWCYADCTSTIGQVNIFNPATGYSREIANCGSHATCVGFLPVQVNLANLPPGKPNSVLPIPKSLDYERTFLKIKNRGGGFSDPLTTTHELMCNKGALRDVRNKTTGEIDFVLPKSDSCGIPVHGVYPTQPIIFALSPDKKYYAITDSSEYTALYDAQTGDRIARMNFYGIELSFSDDSRSLITMGRYATATWDIQELLTNTLKVG